MKYKWLLFDADDTLFDFSTSAQLALQETFFEYGIPYSKATVATYERINHQVWTAFERQEITALELRKIRFERLLQALELKGDGFAINAHYLERLSQKSMLLAGTSEFLTALKQSTHHTALITNGLKEVQRPRIASANFDHFFPHIVISDEIGVAKPHQQFFDHAFETIGFPAKEEVLVIGDSLSSDIQGGNNYGVSTCWFNPKGKVNSGPHQPKYEVSKLDELWKLISH